jgi:PAS domain S-box-containing protein
MTDNGFDFGVSAAYQRLERLSRRAEDLPADARELVNEILETFGASVEKLEVGAKELQQHNLESSAPRDGVVVQGLGCCELFEFASDGYLLTDPAGLIQGANRAAADLLGVPKVDLQGQPMVLYVAPDERDRFQRNLDGLLKGREAGGSKANWEMRLQPSRGPAFLAVLTVVPGRDTSGEIVSLHWLLRDITDGKRAEERERLLAEAREQGRGAEEANRLLQALIRTMPIGAIVADGDGQVLTTNAAGRAILGGPVEGTVAHPERHYTPYYPDGTPLPPEDMPLMHALREGQTVRDVEILIRREDGDQRAILAGAAPVRGEGGAIVSGVTVFQDITERKRAEAEHERLLGEVREFAIHLERERELLQTIMENTRAQLAYLDTDFNFVRVNEAYAQGSGHDREELVGRNHFDLFPHAENEAIFQRVRDTGQGVEFRAKPFEYPDQPERGVTYWDWTLVPEKDGNGQVRGLVFSLVDVTERERLMEQLESERAKLQAIIENAPEAIVVVDEEARITLTNRAADRIYTRRVPIGEGYESHAELGICRPDGTAILPRDLPLTRSALDGESHRGEELAIVWPSGGRRNLLVDTAPIWSSKGEIGGAVGVFRDITELKQAEDRVRQYADRLRALHEMDRAILAAQSAEEIGDAALKHLQGLVPARRASVEMFDLEAGETSIIAFRTDKETEFGVAWHGPLKRNEALRGLEAGLPQVVADIREIPSSPLVEALAAEGVRSYVSLPLRAGGELIGALSLGRSVEGRPTADQMDAIRDVADELAIGIRQAQLHERVQQHAEELGQLVEERTAELRASEARFRTIFEQSVLGIALLDKRGRVITSNPALQGMLNRSSEELAGEVLAHFAHPDEEVGADLRVYREMADGERDYHRMETRYIAADGETRWANLVLSLGRSPTGEPKFAIAIIEDVTEAKRAQAALIQSEKLAMTGRLAASLAHEVNNPLQTVIGCLGLAEESLAEDDGDDLEEYLTMAHEELRRAARIVSRLRDLSRPADIDAREPTDVNALVDRVLKLSRKELKSRQIEVVRQLTDDLPQPLLLPDRIQQVLLNLVLNAVDAMPGGGRLVVITSCDEASGEVAVTISDDGPGIPADVLPRLFEPFFSMKPKGLGLGLFVSQNIVQEHGGRIEVDSAVGHGATFTVHLPL